MLYTLVSLPKRLEEVAVDGTQIGQNAKGAATLINTHQPHCHG